MSAIPGFLNETLTLPEIDSYTEDRQTPFSVFECSTEYFIENHQIRYCELTINICVKHARDADVDREDLRLPFMVLANEPNVQSEYVSRPQTNKHQALSGYISKPPLGGTGEYTPGACLTCMCHILSFPLPRGVGSWKRLAICPLTGLFV